MKTAISVPDQTFERATQRAQQLGMSRSEFFARAAQRYLDEMDAESLTDQVNAALERLEHECDAASAIASGRRVLDGLDDEW